MSKKLTILQARKLFDEVEYDSFTADSCKKIFPELTKTDIQHFTYFSLVNSHSDRRSGHKRYFFIKDPHKIII